jgi:large subunit ribosomal protein L17
MRHLKHRFQLGRKKEHRIALMSNLGAALLRHDRIQTTLPKAKALRPFVEKIITLAKKAENATPERALHYRRLALSRIRDKEAVGLLFNEKVTSFSGRTGGYTRIYKLGTRTGDAAEMAVIQLIGAEDEGYAKKSRKSRPSKKAAPAGKEEENAQAAAAATAEPEAVEAEEKPAEEAPEKPEPVAEEATPESDDSGEENKKA